ncbi:MAG TPA: universal stress protein [Solirubrobacteraceae bacterium]|jgi:nucleotide-binding universal stress UspA family protein|nr:universal stress protein [Solirubrobacteraceae bacterium]
MTELVLCAVDGSDASDRVLDTAGWLSGALGARLLVVHVADDDQDTDASVRATVRRALPGTPADVRLIKGSPARAIMDAAEDADAELVVIGSRGRGPLRSALLGSVSHAVTVSCTRPVVVVPSSERWATVNGDASIVCGVDGSEDALAAAALAGQLATRLGLRLVVVHARQDLKAMAAYPGARSATPPATGQEDSVRELVDTAVRRAQEATGMTTTAVVEAGPPSEVLEAVADREHARLIVIATRGAGGLRSAVLGSVAGELSAAAARPVLLLSDVAA